MVGTTNPVSILGIPGSLRQTSYNKAALSLQLARSAARNRWPMP
jgi:hypothetical protein